MYQIPPGRYIDSINWPPDSSSITITTANMHPPGPALAYLQIDLFDGKIKPAAKGNYWINNVTVVDNQAVCYDRLLNQLDPKRRSLFLSEYHDVCYFPEIGLYGGLKRGEDAVDYVLLSKDGEV
jgi:hypothetical protein